MVGLETANRPPQILAVIKNWVDTQANLPTGQGGFAKADAVPTGVNKAVKSTPETGNAMSEISPDLILAYERTRYVVDAPEGAFDLVIGLPQPRLLALYQAEAVSSAAFLTAWNPFSQQASPEDNRTWQAEMERRAEALAVTQIRSRGVAMSGDWPAEDSTVLLGISLADATMLGREFRQNAFVWCGEGAVPELILLR